MEASPTFLLQDEQEEYRVLFEIPIIVVLLQSIPEGFFLVMVGTKLFNIRMDVKYAVKITLIYGVCAYLYRILFTVFGLHTLFSIITLVLLVKTLRKIPIFHSMISILSSTLLIGILQGIMVPIILQCAGIPFRQLPMHPWVNIVASAPIFMILALLYYILHRTGFYLYNLAGKDESIAKDK